MNRMLAASLLSLAIATAAVAGVKHVDAPHGTVNINTAAAAQLALLPHIGEVMAGRIVDYRTLHGQFRSVSDLLQVKGIDEKKLAALTPCVTLSGPTTATGKLRAFHPSPVVPR